MMTTQHHTWSIQRLEEGGWEQVYQAHSEEAARVVLGEVRDVTKNPWRISHITTTVEVLP